MTDSVRAFVDGRVGRLVLSRPAALNALDRAMIRALTASLQIWQHVPEIHAVVIEGEGRAFCAGGDIRAIRDAAMAGDGAAIEAFFGEEYALNRVIAEYAKPYVALVDGICMGGGIGVSVHGRFRVATEAAMFAMPETGIALFPDVGASFFLPRLPGALGMYPGPHRHAPERRRRGACGARHAFRAEGKVVGVVSRDRNRWRRVTGGIRGSPAAVHACGGASGDQPLFLRREPAGNSAAAGAGGCMG